LLPKALDGRQVAVTVLRAEVCDLEDFLQGPRAAHQFAEDGPDRLAIERPLALLVSLEDVLEDFLFPRRGEDLAAVIVLDAANVARQTRPLIDELEDLQVEFVDLVAQVFQGGGCAGGREGSVRAVALARRRRHGGLVPAGGARSP